MHLWLPVLNLSEGSARLESMITVDTIGKVTTEGELFVKLPKSVPPGEHRVVVVVDTQTPSTKGHEPLVLSPYAVGLATDTTLRREDMYGDDGR